MRRLLYFGLAISLFSMACKRSAPPDNAENARDQSIMKADSQPQDHTAVSPDSAKNTPAMNIGGK
jgi:hypothetical protein